jgi:tetratricopeptide (TPR) repeat protein
MKMLLRVRPLAGIAILSAGLLSGAGQGLAQDRPSSTKNTPSKGDAYFNYSMAHIYAELAAAFGNRSEYLNQAIEYYKAAIQADPGAGFMSTELSDLYVQSGQINKAVTESEAALRANPNNLSARRILGRIYARLIGDPSQNTIREDMLRKALDQYTKIAEGDPKDAEAWIMIGRLEKVANNNAESEKAFQKALELDSDNQDALAGLAMAAAEKGDLATAASLLERSNTKANNPRGLIQLAETYEQLRDFKNAAKAWQRAYDASGGNPEIKRALSNALIQSDQIDEAIGVFEELVEDEPKDLVSVLRLSQLYRQKRDFEKAREFAAMAKEIDGTNIEVLYNEVFILESEGKPAEAITALQAIVKSTERRSYLPQERQNRILLLERLGIMLRSSERYGEAQEAFRQAMALDPEATRNMRMQVIETHRQAREYTEANALLDESLQRDPGNRTLALLKGQILAETGKVAEGAAFLEQALQKKEDLELFIGLAQVYERGKKYDEMNRTLERAKGVATTPEDKVRVEFLRGAMFEKQKKYEQAEAAFQKILEEDPDNASALNYLGYMWVDRNVRLDEAYAMIKKAVEQEPNNSAYLDSLGWAYYRMDKLDKAEEYLKASLERLSKDPTVHDHLGDVYLKQGRVKEAIQQWERSLVEWEASPAADRDEAEIGKIQKKLDNAKVRLAKENPGNRN